MSPIQEAAIKMALEALEESLYATTDKSQFLAFEAIAALRAALAEPGPEPWERRVALAEQEPWIRVIDEAMVTHHIGVADPADDYETAKRKLNNLLCHTQDIGAYFAKKAEPVQEPLSDDEIKHIDDGTMFHESSDWSLRFARAIEQAHGIS